MLLWGWCGVLDEQSPGQGPVLSRRLTPGPRTSTLPPDVLPPDVLPPDVLPPDVLPPDVLPPDTEPAGAAVGGLPLVHGHFVAPPPPPGHVDRPRLRALLDDGVTRALTVVRAPTGWGKTALLAAWATGRSDRRPAVWIRLDPATAADPSSGDGSGMSLWPQLLHGLGRRGLLPAGGDLEVAAGLDRSADGGLGGRGYRQLANLLATLATPVVLLLDDVHLLRRPDDRHGLELLVNEAGGRLRTVLCGRSVPLALHRLRAAGRVSELGPRDLAFTGPELAGLLRAQGVSLSARAASELLELTEGWPVGLRLALSALATGTPSSELPALAEVPEIAEFLRAELLARHPWAVQRFLLRTSVLDQVSSPLADAVVGERVRIIPPVTADPRPSRDLRPFPDDQPRTGRDAVPVQAAGGSTSRPPAPEGAPAGDGSPPVPSRSGAEPLSVLAEDDGFVLAVDGGEWFRYHRLFAAMLRADLVRDRSEDVDELHLRAALWCAAHRRPAEAVRHAAHAGDWWYASSLFLERAARTEGLVGAVLGFDAALADMPPVVASWSPECALVVAAGQLARGWAAKAAAYLETARGSLAGLPAAPRRRALSAQADLMDLHRAELMGDAEEMVAVARRLLRSGTEGDGPQSVAVTALTWCGRGRGELWMGRHEAAIEALGTALDAARLAGSHTARVSAAGAMSLAHALRGRLRSATLAAADALTVVGVGDGPVAATGVVEARLALAVVALCRADRDEAARHLDAAHAGCGPGHPPHLLDLVAVLRARLWCRQGWTEQVRAARRLLGGRGRPAGPPLCLSLWRSVEVDLLLAVGNAQAARQALGRGAESRRGDQVMALATARADLACADLEAAEEGVSALLRADGGGGGPVVAACVLAAVVAARRGDHARSTGLLARALALAEDEGLASPFLDLGAEVPAMIEAHPGLAAAHPDFVAALRVAAAVDAPPAAETRPPPSVASPQPPTGGACSPSPPAGHLPRTAPPPMPAPGPQRPGPRAPAGSGAPVGPRAPVGPSGLAGASGLAARRGRAVPGTPVGAEGVSAYPGGGARHARAGGDPRPRAGAPPADRAGRRRTAGPAAGDRLSERELAVLSYLPTMLTTAEIAAELYVSVNTVKTHLKSIYRKLDVPRRRDAVHRARELHLL